ncbi:hypothetical protein ACQB60_29660 [Actinomycetota bacterium Odt1-20B]
MILPILAAGLSLAMSGSAHAVPFAKSQARSAALHRPVDQPSVLGSCIPTVIVARTAATPHSD